MLSNFSGSPLYPFQRQSAMGVGLGAHALMMMIMIIRIILIIIIIILKSSADCSLLKLTYRCSAIPPWTR